MYCIISPFISDCNKRSYQLNNPTTNQQPNNQLNRSVCLFKCLYKMNSNLIKTSSCLRILGKED